MPVVGLISILAAIPCCAQRAATSESKGKRSPRNALLNQSPASS
ncbi:hypothetical protein YPPY96_4242 [Yersinia pestis PY-96]|nr:hypothetical protein YPPY52_4418 [Yersinia pestis PY-52]EIT24501.1 hypothetical protein YPPY96_4242 [Yersinia pestis PY-96]